MNAAKTAKQDDIASFLMSMLPPLRKLEMSLAIRYRRTASCTSELGDLTAAAAPDCRGVNDEGLSRALNRYHAVTLTCRLSSARSGGRDLDIKPGDADGLIMICQAQMVMLEFSHQLAGSEATATLSHRGSQSADEANVNLAFSKMALTSTYQM